MSEAHVEGVTAVWKKHWDESRITPDSSLRGRLLRRYVSKWGGFSGARYTLEIIERHVPDLRGKTVLDAGSGTGLNSLALSARGADVTLLDIAPQALAIAKTYYDELGLRAKLVEGSIFALPFPDESFDVVWNTGVIEHFQPEERRRALAEMLRVMKKDGLVITINPCARAPIYRMAKEHAERKGTWDVGFELPIDTLADDVDPRVFRLEERQEGWLMQLHFLKFVVPRPLRYPWVVAHEAVQTGLNFLNRMPGYLLVSVVRRRADR